MAITVTPAERTFSVGSDVRETTEEGVDLETTLRKTTGLIAYKDKDEICDYCLNWSARLVEDEVIEASDWLLPVPPNSEFAIYQGLQAFEGQLTSCWFQGGTDGRSYRVVNRVTTSGERVLDCSLTIVIVER